jgi:IS5 family transposase
VRGKEKSKVLFGSKINVSLINGYSFIDQFSWDAFNEGSHLKESIDKYKIRHGYYLVEVSVDQIFCTRSNRKMLNDLNIKLIGRKLGRPPKSGKEKLDPGDRNPIEGKFGQGKTRYGLGLIKIKIARDIRDVGVADHACIKLSKDGQGWRRINFCFDFRGP